MAATSSPSPSLQGGPPPDPDRPLHKFYNLEYPKELWYFISSFIFVVAVFQFGSLLHSKFAGRVTVSDPESMTHTQGGSFRRFPLALLNAYRIIAFRWPVGIGSYTVNLAEAFLTVTYIVIIFTWTFVNSESLALRVNYADHPHLQRRQLQATNWI